MKKQIAVAVIVGAVIVTFLSRNRLLHSGASNGQSALMSVALALGADTNWYSGDGNTPLIAAAAAGEREAVDRLIAAGAKINGKNRNTGATALMVAAQQGNADIIDSLLAAGASLSERDNEKRSAYGYAFHNRQYAVARKVRYIPETTVKLSDAGGSLDSAQGSSGDIGGDGRPPNYVAPETDGSVLTITDTTGWTRVGPNEYTKRVTREEADELDKEKRRQYDEARAAARRKMDEAERNPPRR